MIELGPNKPPGAVKKCGENWPPHAIEGPVPPMAERVNGIICEPFQAFWIQLKSFLLITWNCFYYNNWANLWARNLMKLQDRKLASQLNSNSSNIFKNQLCWNTCLVQSITYQVDGNERQEVSTYLVNIPGSKYQFFVFRYLITSIW